MNDATTMTRYLLGELSDRERAEMEARYCSDARTFAALVEVENGLIDDYVRGRLTEEVRVRFEAAYLSSPARRERVLFARALVRSADAPASAAPPGPTHRPASERAWWAVLRGSRLAMATAAALVLVASGIWLVLDRSPALPDQAAADDAGQAPVAGPRQSRDAAPSDAAAPPAETIVALTLTVGAGERSASPVPPPAVTIPPGTTDVRLQLRLREHDYPRYRIGVRAIGAGEVFAATDLRPEQAGDTAMLAVSVPTGRLTSGDYLLTLHGETAAGEIDELSQTIFRVR